MLRPFALAVLVLSLSGCNLLHPPPPPTPDDALLILINRMDEPVRYVYLAPCASDEWGGDWMDSDEVIMPGRTRTFSLAPGCWDARAVLIDERVIDERGVEMTRNSQRTWALFPDGE